MPAPTTSTSGTVLFCFAMPAITCSAVHRFSLVRDRSESARFGVKIAGFAVLLANRSCRRFLGLMVERLSLNFLRTAQTTRASCQCRFGNPILSAPYA